MQLADRMTGNSKLQAAEEILVVSTNHVTETKLGPVCNCVLSFDLWPPVGGEVAKLEQNKIWTKGIIREDGMLSSISAPLIYAEKTGTTLALFFYIQ